MFIGYPRSGHSLIGSLLNAHPDILIGHEIDALKHVQKGVSRQTLFNLIKQGESEFAQSGRIQTGYNYEVPGAWQGRYRRLTVIGDKKGGKSSLRLYDDPELLIQLVDLVRFPVRAIHVVRSPWDNIATMILRGKTFAIAVSEYFRMCSAVLEAKNTLGTENFCNLRYEDFIASPVAGLTELCDFLNVNDEKDWLRLCSNIVDTAPHHSRFKISWRDEMLDEVITNMLRFPWFRDDDRVFEISGAQAQLPFSIN